MSEQGGTISRLWWVMFWLGIAVYVIVMGFLFFALFRRGDDAERSPWDMRLVIGGGIVLPAVVIAGLFVLSLLDMSVLARADDDENLRIEVVGHQFWWDVRYPELGIRTANEIHVPTGRSINLILSSQDVIHSFWVPRLHGKMDLNPGQTNDLAFEADEAGVYQGQCAEFCGVQHALMKILVVAEEPEDFDRWVAGQQRPAPDPQTPATARGQEIFLGSSCVYCHAISGTVATGRVGPDLTHIASRRTLGAGVVPNTRGNLGGWILNPQTIKPGNKMPPTNLSGPDLQALLDYLQTLD